MVVKIFSFWKILIPQISDIVSWLRSTWKRHIQDPVIDIWWRFFTKIAVRGGSRTAATSKLEPFVLIVNPVTIITKSSILDVAAVLDLPLAVASFIHYRCLTDQPTFICSKSKLTIKTSEQRHWGRSADFIVNFEHISHLFLVFLLLILNK